MARYRSSYGGKGGVWVRKKSRRASNSASSSGDSKSPVDDTVAETRPPTPTTPPPNQKWKSSEDGGSEKPKEAVVSNPASSSSDYDPGSSEEAKNRLIGWDDVKCRPIFYVRQSGGGGGAVADSPKNGVAEDLDTVDDGSGGNETQKGGNALDDGVGDAPNNRRYDDNDNHSHKGRGRARKRAYGSLSSKTGLSGVFTEAVLRHVENLTPEKTPVEVATAPIAPDVERGEKGKPVKYTTFKAKQSTAGLSPVFLGEIDQKSICSALDSIDKAKDPTGRPVKQRRRGAKMTRARQDLSHEWMEHDQEASLDAARLFFRRLDSTQALNIARDDGGGDCDIAPSKEFGAIRTKRNVSMNHPRLKSDYRAYCDTVRDVGVPPIAIREFASQWSAHFSTEEGAMCDGLLDEE